MRERKYLNPTFEGGHIYKWGHIERLKVYRAPVMALDHNGQPYVADPYGGPWTWDLQCDCGHCWTILEKEFPGKFKLRTCGRPECTFSQPKPVRKKQGKGIRSIALDMLVILTLSEYCDKTGLSFSSACNELLRKALGMPD